MNNKVLSVLSYIYGGFGIVYTLLSLLGIVSEGFSTGQILYTTLSLGFFAIISTNFIKNVTARFKVDYLNKYIYFYLGVAVFDLILDLYYWIAGYGLEELLLNFNLMFFSVGLIILLGVTTIFFSIAIKKVSTDYYFKEYSISQLITGICYVTVIGVHLGALVNSISFIILGFIFKEFSNLEIKEKANKIEKNESLIKSKSFAENKYFSQLNSSKQDLKELDRRRMIQEDKSDDKLKYSYPKIENDKKTKNELAEDFYNSLNLDRYNEIKEVALKYLPKNLNDKEKKIMIIKYIEQNMV